MSSSRSCSRGSGRSRSRGREGVRGRVQPACLAAACVLILLLAGVTVNAVCVVRVTDGLTAAARALPERLPEGEEETAALIRALDALADTLASHETWLNLSVSFRLIDRAQELADRLKAAAASGDGGGYASDRASLIGVLSDLGRLEHLRPETVL